MRYTHVSSASLRDAVAVLEGAMSAAEFGQIAVNRVGAQMDIACR
jgi:hypothetical protein